MGRASRWLKALFGIQSKKKHTTNEQSVTSKDKNRRNSGHNPATIPPNITPSDAEWLEAFYSEPDTEQKQKARAMAAATAAAADAAIAAAQAAAAAVRFTSQDTVMFGGRRQKCAAIKIQSLFRGYLARKALRALKGVVKIQALVRGFLVRQQAAATLYSIQALIRAQESVRAHRTRRFMSNGESPKTVEVDTCKSRTSYSYDNSISYHLSCPNQARLSMPEAELSDHFFTPQSTPRFGSSCRCSSGSAGATAWPNYMNKTQSFKAKLRSQSAPKQRRGNSWSGLQAQEALSFKNAVVGKLGRSSHFGV